MLNVEQYKDLMDEIGAATLPDGLKDETDWFKETYKTGISQNYQLSVSNGNEKIRYYIGGGYTDEEGIIAYSSYRSNGIISGTGANLTTPAENMARTENNYSQTDRLLMTGYATIKFNRNLNFKSTVTMDRRWIHDYSFLDPIHTSYGRTQHGEASSTRADDMRMVYDNILTYNNTWNGVHNFEAMGGTSATTSRWENLSGSRNYFFPDYNNVIWGINGGNKGGLRGQSQGYAEWAIMSYLGRVSYNYDSKYYITANIRADGSSKLASGHRWGYFPSVSAAWRISSEPWMQDVSWISDLKLRAGWGQSGNQSGLADYAWVQQYSINYYDWTAEGYEESVPTLGGKSNIGNKDLTWETTTQTNVGVDYLIPVLKEIYAINWLGEMIQSVSEVPARPRGLADTKEKAPGFRTPSCIVFRPPGSEHPLESGAGAAAEAAGGAEVAG